MSTAVLPLVEHFAQGLDAPICLTWELTYACNLACAHCLSSSGRRDPRELTTAEAKAVIDELERMQVFYVNIGGGEPTVRPDFWELVDYATAHKVGVKFSTNGIKINKAAAAAARRQRLRRRADLARRRDRRGQRLRPRQGFLRHRDQGDGEPRRGRFHRVQDLRGLHPAEHRPARRVQGDRRSLPGAAAADQAPAGRPRRRRLGRAAPDRGTAASAVRLAGQERGERPDRRLVLPPGRVRRITARAEPVRRRSGGLPDRPGGRRLRLPVRHPRVVPGRKRPQPRWFRHRLARVGTVHRTAQAAERRRLLVVLGVRFLPRRLHGGEVLHRTAAGRPGPGVRQGLRRDRAVQDRTRPLTETVAGSLALDGTEERADHADPVPKATEALLRREPALRPGSVRSDGTTHSRPPPADSTCRKTCLPERRTALLCPRCCERRSDQRPRAGDPP